MKKLTIPPSIEDEAEKVTEFSYITQEKLRLAHNQKGQDYNDGVITKKEWEDWKKGYFDPRSSAICVEILTAKNLLKKSVKYNPDLDTVFEEV